MIVDSHCHLAGQEFADDLEATAARARAAGVTDLLCVLEAEDQAELDRVPAVRAAWPGVHFTTGIHPHHAERFAGDIPKAVEIVRRAAGISGACAIGEIGLDYHYDFSPRPAQQSVFGAQVRLARELDLPIVIHTRDASDDTFRVLKDAGGARGVFHCFTADVATARRALDLGFYISFSGILTFPRASDLREVATMTPKDRLLSETDSPYLAPVPYRGKRNEPAYVPHVVEQLAKLHGMPVDGMAAQIRSNFQQLFGLAR